MNWTGKTPTADEWRDILEKHARWSRGEADGERANLQGANLQDAYLQGANLQDAYLQGANLQYAYLQGANLQDAYLQGANLQYAYLQYANLQGANLQGANLQGADLQGADLQGADLQGADLQGADLQYAYLSDAKGGDLAIAQTRILPDGDIIGWKKCNENVIVKLRIPSEAKRSHAFGRKCRAEFADVLEVIGAKVGVTIAHGPETTYRVGERVTPDSWDDDWKNECSNGIHFYVTKEEAIAH